MLVYNKLYVILTRDYKYIPTGELYNYIPSHIQTVSIFDNIVLNNMKILDVGSGLGEFMVYLKLYCKENLKINVNISGIEIDEHIKNYVKIPTTFIDAFEFTDYRNYDLIYLYQPIRNVDLMVKLLEYISNFKVQIIYNNSSVSEQQLLELNFIKLKSNIWHYK